MILSIDHILTLEELNVIVNRLDANDFVDGKTTAGWHARTVKQNTQLSSKVPYAKELTDLIKTALLRHPLFQIAAWPQCIHSLLISRYEMGMSYGSHVDNALMGNQEMRRSDISFTLFLSTPLSYGGGELVIESFEDETAFKLEAGSAVIYPSSTLHRVEVVTQGVRLAAVGWVQSLIRDPSEREILFDLDTVRRSIFQKEGKTTEFDLISKSHANLLRKWAQL